MPHDEKDAGIFAHCCPVLLEQPDRASEIGEAARHRFVELVTADAMAQRYEALYRELAAARR
jgi:glycosyltransferase involved in cell wall biosynthesis